MCGIIVDMTIINILIRNYCPKLISLLDYKDENYGDFIGNNFININLINLFTNNYIDKNTSLLIWDLLFINGNIILIKSFLAIYHYLEPFLLESEQTLEEYQKIIKNKMPKLKSDNKDLIFYLIIKDYNFTEEEIAIARFSLSINTASSINKEKEKINIKKKNYGKNNNICDKNWPICRYNFSEYNNKVIFFLVLQKKNKIFRENYFLEKIKENKDNVEKIYNNDNNDDILIERKKHYCYNIKDLNERDKDENNNINKKEEINYNKIIYKPEFIEASKNVLNNLKIKLKNKENDLNNIDNINND